MGKWHRRGRYSYLSTGNPTDDLVYRLPRSLLGFQQELRYLEGWPHFDNRYPKYYSNKYRSIITGSFNVYRSFSTDCLYGNLQ